MRPPRPLAARCDTCGWTDADWDPAARRWICQECDGVVVPPAPGSIDALIEGCMCDRETNHDGDLMPAAGWLVEPACPVHDPQEAP